PGSRARVAGARLEQPTVASNQEQENAPNQVVNVASTHLDIVKGADFIVYEERQDPDHRYSHEKPQRGPEEPFSGRLRKLLSVNRLERASPDERADSEKDQREPHRGQPVAVMKLRHGCSSRLSQEWENRAHRCELRRKP